MVVQLISFYSAFFETGNARKYGYKRRRAKNIGRQSGIPIVWKRDGPPLFVKVPSYAEVTEC